jgi:SAM-dependent methyltransferase
MKEKIKQTAKRILFYHTHYKTEFLDIIKEKGTVLDVGCGTNSPYKTKIQRPDIFYTGIDIGDYCQTQPNLSDKYYIYSPEDFAAKISEMKNEFDAVISAHNLEHCNDREKTLDAMIKTLRKGGFLYLSFPTEVSVSFPGRRQGTLNYYDDPTHKDTPPDYEKTIKKLKDNGMEILFANKSYKPFFPYLLGFMLEWQSKRKKRVFPRLTWAYWGFETIIWARKKT